jgi:pilus assembly protein CpaE
VLQSIIISPDIPLGRRLEEVLHSLGNEVAVSRRLEQYPNEKDLIRTLRTHAPDIVFLSFADVAEAQKAVKLLEAQVEGLQLVAIHTDCDAAILRESMRAGIREFLTEPFERAVVAEALGNVKVLLEKKPPHYETTDQMFAFLPSKAGVGTTTLALNLSGALSRVNDTRVLLADFDLNSGMLRFLLKLKNRNALSDALEHASEMDENLWPQLVTTLKNLDVLHAGPINPNVRIDVARLHDLVHFWLRNYSVVCADLSGNLERYSLELIRESKRVFLVCTPEIASLHLTREKLAFLKSMNLETRVSVILNRVTKRPVLTQQQVEEVLGLSVAHTFSNDYHAVNQATSAGDFVDAASHLGQEYKAFAHHLLQQPVKKAAEGKRRFLEFFSVPANN